MSSAIRRDIGPALQKFRALLLGREHNVALRFEDGVADRTQPPPDVPGGPAHILSANYYCNRDPRREVAPPIDLLQEALESGTEKGDAACKPTAPKLITPGKVYIY